MAGNSQPKTKAEILRELQSIQHLLDENADSAAHPEDDFPALDDDEIPLLDAFLTDDDTDTGHEEHLASHAETLDALNAAYAALTGELEQLAGDPELKKHEKTPEKKPPQQPSAQAAPRTNAPPHAQQAKQAHQSAPAHAKPRPHEPENRDQLTEAESFGFELEHELKLDQHAFEHLGHTDPAAPAPLPGQQSLFEPAKSDASGKKTDTSKPDATQVEAHDDKDTGRPAPVTKASGENPFLPQHIRERLRGNQPLPKGEFLLPMTPPAYLDMGAFSDHDYSEHHAYSSSETSAPMVKPAEAKPEASKPARPDAATQHQPQPAATAKQPTKQAKPDIATVINEVIEEFLPMIEARLRKRLTETLNDEEPTDH